MNPRKIVCVLGLLVSSCGVATAQHEHHSAVERQVVPPTVFLDKSPRVVEYQLKRLSNEQLLMIETATNDKKYIPVLSAILSREGMPASNRTQALLDLVKLNGSNPVVELTAAIGNISGSDAVAVRAVRALAEMLMNTAPTELNDQRDSLIQLAQSKNEQHAAVGLAALILSGRSDAAFELARMNSSLEALMAGIPLIPNAKKRGELQAEVLAATAETEPATLRRAAIAALASIPVHQAETFLQLAEFVKDDALRESAVRTLLTLAPESRDARKSQELVAWLVDFAESTPAAERTSESFVDAMELVDQLLSRIPSDIARDYRNRLRETVVRVIRIRTVAEEMRYDLPFFAVEAGRPVQVVLINRDIMPHNLVLTQPGALQEVAELGLQTGPDGGLDGKQYVPHSDKVLFATHMVGAEEQQALTFNAPQEPGEYPYVCTFPRHWMRMYGVMVVVKDLDAWLKNPVVPKDPVGSNRQFVQSWTVADFQSEFATGLRGRSPEIGKRLFVEASCAQCHKAGELAAGNVGPDLSEVMARRKGDLGAVLQEILDPSHRIEPKYVVHIVVTADGKTVTGLVVDENKDTISILENPEAKQPTVINQDEVEGIRQTSNSMMPKGLLDRFSKDEVFEILAFIQSVQKQ